MDAFERSSAPDRAVVKWPIRAGALGAPVELDIYQPSGPGPFPVAVLAHGFLLDKDDYGRLARALGAQGCVIVVPQLHRPKVPFNVPSSGEDGATLKSVVEWLDQAPADLRRTFDLNRVYAAGHSRGAKAWWQAMDDLQDIDGYLAIDPADGGFEAPVFGPQTAKQIPAVVVGGGLSTQRRFGLFPPAVFPDEGFEKVAKYTGPATNVVRLPKMGHFDMLDPAGPLAVERWTVVAGKDPASTVASIAGAFGRLLRDTATS